MARRKFGEAAGMDGAIEAVCIIRANDYSVLRVRGHLDRFFLSVAPKVVTGRAVAMR